MSTRTRRPASPSGGQHRRDGASDGSEQRRRRQRRDPYEVLGVSRDATPSQIKSAYHKLALKYHPDKVQDPTLKAEASSKFAEIGAAYEILTCGGAGDASGVNEASHPSFAGREDDYEGGRWEGGADAAAGGAPSSARFYRGSPAFDFDDFFFPAAGVGGGFRFTDPFELFRNTFASDFAGVGGGGVMGTNPRSEGSFADPFFGEDSFFGGVGGGGSFGMSNSPVMSSFFGGGGTMMPPSAMMSSSSGFGDEGMIGNNGMGGFSRSFTYSSSSTGGGRMGESRSVSRTTRVVNGRAVTQTETTVVRPDGTRETTIDLTGDEDDDEVAGRLTDGRRDASSAGTTERTIRSGRVREGGRVRPSSGVDLDVQQGRRVSRDGKKGQRHQKSEGQRVGRSTGPERRGTKRKFSDIARCLCCCFPFPKRQRRE